MAITNYTELQTAVGDNLARSDLTAFIPDIITLAENVLNYGSAQSDAVRCREMETVSTLTPTSGVCTIPTDYLEFRRVVEVQSTRRNLTFITPDAADILWPERSSGNGEHFTIIGSSLYTFPLVSNNVELTYFAALPALASNSTNWLLSKAPGVYLRAALMMAAEFIKDDAEMGKQAALLSALVAGLNRSDMIGKYARASVMVRGATP